MSTLLAVTLFSVLLAYLSDSNSRHMLDEYGNKIYWKKDKLIFGIMMVILAAYVGLRTRGNDTGLYRSVYNTMPSELAEIANINWQSISGAPGLQCLEIILRHLGATAQDYCMITALFVNCTYLWFIRKYTNNITLSVYYFITMGVYTFTLAAIKQTVAVAFLLLATDRAFRKKWVGFLFWLGIAELFHPYAFIYLVVPFLFFEPWTKRTYYLLAGTIVVALSFSKLLGAIDTVTVSLGYSYSQDSFKGAGVNVFRVLVVWVPLVLSFFVKEKIQRTSNKTMNIIVNLSMINSVIMFIGLFGTANYFARLANYFLIFQALALPWILACFTKDTRKVLTISSIVGFAAYFYYQTNVVLGAFENTYGFMSIWSYCSQMFRNGEIWYG